MCRGTHKSGAHESHFSQSWAIVPAAVSADSRTAGVCGEGKFAGETRKRRQEWEREGEKVKQREFAGETSKEGKEGEMEGAKGNLQKKQVKGGNEGKVKGKSGE